MTWRLGELLVQKKLINWLQLAEALAEQKQSKELIGQILVRKGYLSEDLLYKALAEQHNLCFLDLRRTKINPQAVALVPADFARTHGIMPVEYYRGKLTVAISNPLHVWPANEIKNPPAVTTIQQVLCRPADIAEFLRIHYA